MPKERDLISLLETGASENPDKPLYSFLDRNLQCTETLTYRSLFDDAVKLACHLQRSGLNRTPVLLIQQKNAEFVKSFWACLLAGAWPMPCARPRGQRWQQLAAMAAQSGASALITSSEIARYIPRHDMPDTQLIITDDMHDDDIEVCEQSMRRQWVRPSICSDDIAFIQYTSGSTSRPKGVVITHGNVMNNLDRITRAFSCTSSDVGLSWLPLHHDMGLIGHVLQPLFAGIHNYFLNPVDFLANPSRWIEAISSYRVTISGGPGFAFGFCARQPGPPAPDLQLKQWRVAYCGSDRITAGTLRQFATRYQDAGFVSEAWFPCYGMAESTLYVCGVKGLLMSSDVDDNKSHVCIGDLTDASSGAEIKVIDCDSQQMCPDGVVGEIWISSGSVSPGYYRQSILSRQSFNQVVDGRADYFRTGDLGFVREGKLYFSGRLKNVLKIRGRNLHAEDIESLLQFETADTGLQRCVALGVLVDDMDSVVILAEHRSRRPDQHIADRVKLERQIKNLVCDTFGVVPYDVLILPAATLPLTSSGKPVRSRCVDVYTEFEKTGRSVRYGGKTNMKSSQRECLTNA